MHSTFRAAYAKRLRGLADQMADSLKDGQPRRLLAVNTDLWAALDADARSGLFPTPETLTATLLTRARTVAEYSRHGTPEGCERLILLNRQTADLLTS